MSEDLLKTPERGVIETFLQRFYGENGDAPTYERLLGFLSGVVITPGRLMPSEWMQPLLDLNDIIFDDIDDTNQFMNALMPLYNRINAVRIGNENLCPFDLRFAAESEEARKLATEWAIGLHEALTLRPEIWAPEGREAMHVPVALREEVSATIPFLWAIAEPESISEIVPDPIPFQRNLLSKSPGWTEEMLSETWDEELLDLFSLFCVSRLEVTMQTLQSYAMAYDREVTSHQNSPKKKVGRNEPCPCGSGLKFKRCCGA